MEIDCRVSCTHVFCCPPLFCVQGIELVGNVFSAVIKRNTPIPCTKTRQYTTEEDNQTGLDISIYEGERPITTANNLLGESATMNAERAEAGFFQHLVLLPQLLAFSYSLPLSISFALSAAGEFHLDGIERAKRGEPKIDVTFQLDANGILTVTALDVTTKARANVTIANATGHRSSDEIDAMVAEAEKMAKDDAARLALIEARNELEAALYQVKSQVNTPPPNASLAWAPNAALSAEVERIQAWVDAASEGTPLSAFKAKMAELQAAVSRA